MISNEYEWIDLFDLIDLGDLDGIVPGRGDERSTTEGLEGWVFEQNVSVRPLKRRPQKHSSKVLAA